MNHQLQIISLNQNIVHEHHHRLNYQKKNDVENDLVSFLLFFIPVIGASTSIMVFSCRNSFAPSSIILSATSSVTRPSDIKCVFNISTRGFPRESNTS